MCLAPLPTEIWWNGALRSGLGKTLLQDRASCSTNVTSMMFANMNFRPSYPALATNNVARGAYKRVKQMIGTDNTIAISAPTSGVRPNRKDMSPKAAVTSTPRLWSIRLTHRP